ncbi:MAG: hypothetical protein ACE5HD_07180 [Acidobacteriota bacterium]
MPEQRRGDTLAVAALMILVALFMAPALRPGRILLTFDPGRWAPWSSSAGPDDSRPAFNADSARFVLTRERILRESLRGGELPLWNPRVFLGAPFLALWQTGVLYPPNLIGVFLESGTALGWLVFFHLLVAGLGAYGLCRGTGLGKGAGLLAGICFTLGGHMALRMGHPSFITTAAWLPWTVLAAERMAASGQVRWRLLLVATWTLLVLAGQASLVILSGYTLCAWGAVAALGRGRRRLAATGLLLGVLGSGLLLAAPQLLPSLEMARHSARSERRLASLRRTALPAFQMLQLVAPESLGTVRNGTTVQQDLGDGTPGDRPPFAASVAGYAGAWVPALAVIGLLGGAWEGRRLPLALILLAALLIALGSPLFSLAYFLLPGFRFSAANRSLVIYLFCLVLLAARGAHLAAAGKVSRRLLWSVAGGWSLLALVVWIGAGILWLPSHLPPSPAPGTLATVSGALDRFLILSLAGAGLLAAAGWRPPFSGGRSLLWWLACLGLVAAELASFAAPYRVVRLREEVLPETPALHWLRGRAEPWRVARFERHTVPVRKGGLVPANLLSYFGLREPGGFAPMHSRALDRYLSAAGWRGSTPWTVRAIRDEAVFRSPLFRLLAVRYIVAPPGETLSGLRRVFQGHLSVWEVPDPLAPAFLVRRTETVADQDAALARLTAPGFHPEELATVEGVAALVTGEAARDPASDSARVVARGFNQVTLETEASGEAWLVLLDAWAPGWRVWIDGKPRGAAVKTDAIFRGVAVPPGRHRVVFRYRPAAFRLGLGCALVALALLAGLMLAGRFRLPASPLTNRPRTLPESAR